MSNYVVVWCFASMYNCMSIWCVSGRRPIGYCNKVYKSAGCKFSKRIKNRIKKITRDDCGSGSVGHSHQQPRMHDLLMSLQVRERLERLAARLTRLRLAAFVLAMVLQMALVDERSAAVAVDTILQALLALDAMYRGRHKVAATVLFHSSCEDAVQWEGRVGVTEWGSRDDKEGAKKENAFYCMFVEYWLLSTFFKRGIRQQICCYWFLNYCWKRNLNWF